MESWAFVCMYYHKGDGCSYAQSPKTSKHLKYLRKHTKTHICTYTCTCVYMCTHT